MKGSSTKSTSSQSHEPRVYDSPEKNEVRTQLWLPAIREAIRRVKRNYPWRNPRYLTFPGPNCLDLRLFVDQEGLFSLGDVLGVEVGEEVAKAILGVYPRIQLERGRFEDVVHNQRFSRLFPFDVVNLDFDGNCFDNRFGGVPLKLRAIDRTFELQATAYTSFDMFLTFEASYQEGRPAADRDVEMILYDQATRLGTSGRYLHVATDGIQTDFYQSLLDVIPSVVIRLGWEAGFDTALVNRAYYKPTRSTPKTIVIAFVFASTWMHVPLSIPRWDYGSQTSPEILRRQQEALDNPTFPVKRAKKKTSRG